MKHQQILDKLAAGILPETVLDETRTLAARSFLFARQKGVTGAQHADVVPPLLERWSGALTATGSQNAVMDGHKTAIALATALHSVGLAEGAVTEHAVRGIGELNDAVWLSDEFARQSPAMIALLRSEPVPLVRKPATREIITFTRPGDVLAFHVGGRVAVGHVIADVGVNAVPVIELYERVFTEVPQPQEVIGSRAAGAFRAGSDRREHAVFEVFGLRNIPDPAGQIVLIAAAIEARPDRSHLSDPGYLATSKNLFEFLALTKDMVQGTGRWAPPRA